MSKATETDLVCTTVEEIYRKYKMIMRKNWKAQKMVMVIKNFPLCWWSSQSLFCVPYQARDLRAEYCECLLVVIKEQMEAPQKCPGNSECHSWWALCSGITWILQKNLIPFQKLKDGSRSLCVVAPRLLALCELGLQLGCCEHPVRRVRCHHAGVFQAAVWAYAAGWLLLLLFSYHFKNIY